MRTFVLGSGTDRQFVRFEVSGRRMVVIRGNADGTSKRSEKELATEAEAASAAAVMARELASRGYVERSSTSGGSPAATATKASKPAKAEKPSSAAMEYLLEEDEGTPAPVIPRLAPVPAAASNGEAPKKKTGGKKKKKKGEEEKKDWLFLGGLSTAVVAFVGLMGYFVYSAFLVPPKLEATWAGSRMDKEPGGPPMISKFKLVLNEKKQAVLTLQDTLTSAGKYSIQGDRITLDLEEGDKQVYKFLLSHSELELLDPKDGKQVMRMRRQGPPEPINAEGKVETPPDGLAEKPDVGAGDAAGDAKLVTQEFVSKDTAFKCLYPTGWESKNGSRPDNTYSWAEFTKGSARIRVDADVQGSLISGSDTPGGNDGEDEYGPVDVAHESNKRTVSESYTDYKESEAARFDGGKIQNGRIANFSAKGGGLIFAADLKGYRVTLLTNNRRVTILCQAPEDEFEKYKPTFLAFCRNLGR